MRIKHVLMMVGLTLVMVVLGLSVGREGSSVVEARAVSMKCTQWNGGACEGAGACIDADSIRWQGPCAFSCVKKYVNYLADDSTVNCTVKGSVSGGGGSNGGSWGGGLPSAWSDCYYQAVCDNSGTNCI